MDDAPTRSKINEAVKAFLEIEDDFKGEKAKTLGEINTRKKAAEAKVYTRIAKLDITKAAFDESVKWHRHIRDGKSVFPKIDNGEDLELVGGFSRVLLATGIAFEPIYDKSTQKHMTDLAEELTSSPIDDSDEEVVVDMHRKTEAA
jgi:hypothetical protein